VEVLHKTSALRTELSKVKRPLGFVPTMGALHAGHMTLIHRARSENDFLVVSIFVNPTQFSPREDYLTYPRDMDGDILQLMDAGVDVVFVPAVYEVYPKEFDTYIEVGHIAETLEGKSRPEHFRGVATVVCKLLSLVRPDKAYFGQKDAQQCLVVKQVNADLNLGANIVVVPTVRDHDGVAVSSRNAYLKNNERIAASVIYKALRLAVSLWEDGVSDAEEVRSKMRSIINQEPLAEIDYLSIADAMTLAELDQISGSALVSLAVGFGTVRLIDNITIGDQT